MGCTSNDSIRLNDKQDDFKEFPVNKTVQLVPISDELMEEPSQMLLDGDYLIINEFNKANDAFISIYSLTEDTVVNSFMSKGNGPGEILSCHIDIADNKLWVYDMSGQRAGCLPMDSLLSYNPLATWAKLDRFYYSFAQLNDSVMLGTNDMTSTSKLSFVHLNTGEVEGKGEYAYLDERIPSTALIDACYCYVNVNPRTKDIALAYRYTDVVEFYDSTGQRDTFTKPFSEQTARDIDNEVQSLVNEAAATARNIIEKNLDKIKTMAQLLVERETIFPEDIENILGPSARERLKKQAEETASQTSQPDSDTRKAEPEADTASGKPATEAGRQTVSAAPKAAAPDTATKPDTQTENQTETGSEPDGANKQ